MHLVMKIIIKFFHNETDGGRTGAEKAQVILAAGFILGKAS